MNVIISSCLSFHFRLIQLEGRKNVVDIEQRNVCNVAVMRAVLKTASDIELGDFLVTCITEFLIH